ncbi:MAG TPA: aromatic ring-hydroxylating dioxygenase subunit alpha [Stellaceae bacterium]|nr:aromatic ring-hydroxylating dioxygenase subunit alpha [Stellaceae bacterium]
MERPKLPAVGDRRTDPTVFFDPGLFEEEQGKIFGRCWLFLAHESQLPNNGDFVTTAMGYEPIIVWRGRDGVIRAFINSCRHRGMKICRVDHGTAKVLSCPYHAWSFSAEGKLTGVPSRERYPESFDPNDWGLIPVPKLRNYHGFIFGSLAENGESFEDYLGEFKYYFDVIARRTEAGYDLLPGKQTWRMKVNWKLGAEQTSGDNYHAPYAHRSIAALGFLGDMKEFAKRGLENDFQVGERGHGLIVLGHPIPPNAPEGFEEYEHAVREDARRRLSPTQANLTTSGLILSVFPNLVFILYLGGMSLRYYQPVSTEETELIYWTLVDHGAPAWRRDMSRREVGRSYNALGIIDSDDAEMWMGCMQGLRGHYRRKFPLNYDLGRATVHRENERPGSIDSTPSEVGVFGFWERWQELMREPAEA